jgi:hypothetical protein
MKLRHIFIAVVLFGLFAKNVIAQGHTKQEHTKMEIRYLHRYDWGDERDRYVKSIYIDNFCYFYDGYGDRYWLLVRMKGSSVADGIYGRFESFPPNSFPYSSTTGAWTGGYGVEGGPYATEVLIEKESAITKEDLLKLNLDIVKMFREEYLLTDKISNLARFCDLVNVLTKEQLRLLRNTIYAVHGYKFKTNDMNEIFGKCDWYKVDSNFSENRFTDTERIYLALIKQAEQIAK